MTPLARPSHAHLNEDLEFRLVSAPPRYAGSTDKPVEYYAVVSADRHLRGFLWACDADDAAGFQRQLIIEDLNGSIFWHSRLLDGKARGLSPSQAVQDLFTEPGTPLSGRILPETRSVGSLTELAELAAEGTKPPKDPVKPRGWRPDPQITTEESTRARTAGGWLYRVDEGHDPAHQVPPHAVAGAWQVNSAGRVLRFWHNPAYGTTPTPVAQTGAGGPLPPLRAGRRPAGRALLDWLKDPAAPRLCRIAGSSGIGRTHLLSWLAAACPPDNPRTGRRVHTLLNAEGLTVRSATWRLADRLEVAARTPTDLMEALQDAVPRTLIVTDLDRAGTYMLPGMPERIAVELLTPLLQIPWLRLLVEAGSDTPAAAMLHTASPGGAAVLDLDDARWTEHDRFTAWRNGLTGHPVSAVHVYPSPGLAQLSARTPAGAATPGPRRARTTSTRRTSRALRRCAAPRPGTRTAAVRR